MDSKYLKRALYTLTLLFIASSGVFAQGWNLPDNRKNDRFGIMDEFEIHRPALSMRGFDNTVDQNQYSSTTYGVRQVLEKAYGIGESQVESVELVYQELVRISNLSFENFDSDGRRDINSRRFESRAFVALMSFIIEENPTIFTSSIKSLYPDMPSHSTAMNRLLAALRVYDKTRYFRKNVSSSNPFKRTVPLMKVARAWDLYLALENAYEDLGGDTSLLLNQLQKEDWNLAINSEMQTIWSQTLAENDFFADLFGVNNHEVQPGNWPLISFVSLGYVALGFNGSFTSLIDDQHFGDPQGLNEVFSFAMKSAAFHYTDSGDKRFNYWWYQTSNGEPFFAEGPYYLEVALPRLLSFWHAVRANDKLGATNEGDDIDPFNYAAFTKVLKWHAKISTPDGRTPPIDDGNKKEINSANLLSWSSAYGDEDTGKLFATIRDKLGGSGSNANYRLIEIAIPRVEKNMGTDLPEVYGNVFSALTEQQSVVRFNDAQDSEHYLFLNGEHGNAIKRGEGHEQPDQLQLLYYVDEHSYLVDSGYDSGSPNENSFRNGYKYHNTMQYHNTRLEEVQGYVAYQNFGGLESPYVSASKTRKVSNHKSINDSKLLRPSANVKLLTGEVDIYYEKKDDHTATYDRKVIFVEDQNPYIIDINRVVANSSKNNFVMRYHGNGSQISTTNGWTQWSNSIDGASKKLYNYTVSVENSHDESYSESSSSLEILEYPNNNGSGKTPYPIQVKSFLFDKNDASFETIGFLKVSGSTPNYRPKSKLIAGGKYAYLKQSSNVVDVVVSRFGSINSEFNFNINSDVYIPYLSLDSGEKYGYARLVKNSSGWEIDTDYQVNLERNVLPLSVSLSGPVTLNSEQVATWTANAYNAKGAVNYNWYRKEDRNSSWNSIGVTGDQYSTYFYNPSSSGKQGGIRVEVTSAGESDVASKSVIVSPSSDDCNSLTASNDGVGTNRIPPACKSIAESKAIPEEFGVESNYPNPFNPSTTIKFGLPEQADVTLNVYNILGQRVAALVNETKAAGYYEVRFDASNLASGFYIGRLVAKGKSGKPFVKELKMQLVK